MKAKDYYKVAKELEGKAKVSLRAQWNHGYIRRNVLLTTFSPAKWHMIY